MSTIVTTGVVLEPFGRLHLKLKVDKPTPLKMLSDICENLFRIASKYKDNTDPLSKKLQECLYEICGIEDQLATVSAEETDRISTLIMNGKLCLKNLRDNILVDDLFEMPLKAPFIENGEWVWDGAIKTACENTYVHLGINPESPITQAPFRALNSHDFAQEVLDYLPTLPTELLLPTAHEELALAAPEELYIPQDPEEAPLSEALIVSNYHNFRHAGQAAKAKAILEKTTREISLSLEVFKKIQYESKRIAAEELELRRIRSEEHTQFIVASIQAMKKAHRDEKALLAAQIARLQQDLRQTQQDLAQAQAQIEQHSQRIAALEARIRDLQGQLNSMQNDGDDGCIIM